MTSIDRFQSLPVRLRRAVWIWLGLAPVAALFSGLGREAMGVLAHPAFWCGLLPLIALAAQYQALFAVVAGTTLGMLIANVPAVLLGDRIATLELLASIRNPESGRMLRVPYALKLRQSTGPVQE